MPVTKAQLAHQLTDHPLIAAFVIDPMTQFAPNPFPINSAGALCHVWSSRAFEFRCVGTLSTGLPELLDAVAALDRMTPLRLHILRLGPHAAHVFTAEPGGQLVGAVLFGATLPDPKSAPARKCRPRTPGDQQLDLFAAGP